MSKVAKCSFDDHIDNRLMVENNVFDMVFMF